MPLSYLPLLIKLKGLCYDRGVARKLKTKRDYSCGGVVWDDNNEQVLMVRVVNLKRERIWTFPKGHPEGQEADEQAALREVREETGWECEIECPLLDVHYSYISKGIKYNKTVRWFFMHPVKEVGKFDPDEVLECKWMDFNEAKNLVRYESDIKLIKRVELLT
jgi:8-oxo-dGTP pyrophosphatase MutT (NUDIX family)